MLDIEESSNDLELSGGLLAIAGSTDWMGPDSDRDKAEQTAYRSSTAFSSRQGTTSAIPSSASRFPLDDVKLMLDESTQDVMRDVKRQTDDLWEIIQRWDEETRERFERRDVQLMEIQLKLDELEIGLAELSRRTEETSGLLTGFGNWGFTGANAFSLDAGAIQPQPDIGQEDVGDTASEADSDFSRASSPPCESIASSDSDDIPLHEQRLAASDLVDILTTDGAIISAPRLLLTRYMTFFADLPPFLDTASGHTRPPPLELPSATSGGLELVIGLLRANYLGGDTDEDPSNPERELYFEDLQRIVDALIIADMYDIPAIPAIFAQTSYDSVDGYPLWAWVLGTLAGGHPCIDFPSLIVDTLQVETHQLPSEARVILYQYVPDALAVLEADQARWMGMVDKLLAEWTSLAPMSTGINRYTLKCLGRTKRYTKDGPGCLTRRAWPDWHKLRKEIAEGAFEAGLSGGYIYSWNVWNYVDTRVRCETCAERLYNTFRPALVAFRDQCPPRCELQFYCETCYYDAPKDYWTVDGPLVSAWTKQNPGVKKRALYWPYKEGEKVF